MVPLDLISRPLLYSMSSSSNENKQHRLCNRLPKHVLEIPCVHSLHIFFVVRAVYAATRICAHAYMRSAAHLSRVSLVKWRRSSSHTLGR